MKRREYLSVTKESVRALDIHQRNITYLRLKSHFLTFLFIIPNRQVFDEYVYKLNTKEPFSIEWLI